MNTLLLIIIYGSFISLGLPDALLGVSWPIMQKNFLVPSAFAGFISMTISGGTIISSLFSGRILKRFGTGKVTAFSIILTALALWGFSISSSFYYLILLAIPLGLGAGAVDSGLNSYIAEHYESHHMSWLHCFWGIGAMTGPILMSGYISAGNSWRNVYFIISIMQFSLAALLFISLPLWKKAPQILKTKENKIKETLSTASHDKKSLFYPLKIKGVKIALVSFLFYCGIESTVGLWGSSFLIHEKGMDIAGAAAWISVFYASITFGRFIAGFITMKIKNKLIIRAGEITILAGVILLLLPLPNIFTLLGIILIGLGCAPIYPCMLHETPLRFGTENSQFIMGFQMATAYIGATFLPPIFGLIASVSTFYLFPIFILVYIFAMLISSEKVNLFMKRKSTI